MFGRILQHSFGRQRRRKSLALAAVTAGMAVATAMLSLRVNLGDDLGAELRHVGANILVTPAADSLPVTLNGIDLRPAGSGVLLPESDLPKIKTVFWANNIVAFAPELTTPAEVDGVPVTVEGTWFDQAVTVPGSGATFRTGMRPLATAWSIRGQWPADGSNQVLVGERLARRLRVTAGSTIRLQHDDVREDASVAGVVASGQAEDGEIVTPLGMAQRLGGTPGEYRQVLVSAVTKPEDAFARQDPDGMNAADAERWICSPYATSIAAELQQALPGASASVVRPVAESEGAILSRLQLLIWFITLLALAASGLAISSAMTAAVMERREEVALMKAVGAQDQAIGALFCSEALVLGLAGGLLGYGAGAAVAQGIAHGILGHAVAWKPVLLPLMLLLAAGVALAGSWRPLRRAMQLEPAVILRGDV